MGPWYRHGFLARWLLFSAHVNDEEEIALPTHSQQGVILVERNVIEATHVDKTSVSSCVSPVCQVRGAWNQSGNKVRLSIVHGPEQLSVVWRSVA